MSLPGSAPLGGMFGQRGAGPNEDGSMSEQQMVKYVGRASWQNPAMQAAFESCPTKTVMAGGMGFALGGMFGLFMSSMRYDTPASMAAPGSAASTITSLPIREQLRHGLKDMGRASYSSAKNFGTVGAVFSGVECCIEGLRAKNDLGNGVAGGCITGAILARKAGPQAMAIGCGGFAAFSAAIDSYMRQPSESVGGKIE